MSFYVTLDELKQTKDQNGNVYDLSMFTDEELQSMLDAAEEQIQKVTGNVFGPFEETWHIDGSGEDVLMFPPAITYPLLEIDSVEEIDLDGAVIETLIEGTDIINNAHYLRINFSRTWEPRRRVAINGVPFVKGLRNYKVVGTWGMWETPAIVKKAIALLAIEMLMPGTTYAGDGNVESFRLGDYAVKFGNSQYDKTYRKHLTGHPLLDAWLRPYVNYSTLVFNHVEFADLIDSTYVGT